MCVGDFVGVFVGVVGIGCCVVECIVCIFGYCVVVVGVGVGG